MATWAKGIDFKNSSNTKRIGGVGVYGNNSSPEKIYIGLGAEPWNNAGLQLSSSSINFKGNKIYHAGDKPTPAEIGAAAASHSHSYLPLSGGTITNSNFGPLVIKRSGSTNAASIVFSNDNGTLGSIGMSASKNGGLIRWTDDTSSNYTILDTGNYKNFVTPASIGAAASSHTHNYIPLSGSTAITGALRSNSEIQTTSQNAFRAVNGNYGFFIRNDGSNTWFMLTNSGDQYGSYNSLRPISVNNANGLVTFGNGLKGTLDGNASTATKLQTTRTINGTNFNGSGNITTATWGTARTLTIGNTGKSVNGSGNVWWSLAEIGAAPSIHYHSTINSAGNINPQTGRTQNLGNMYTYNTASGNTGAPTTYTSVIGFGRGDSGTVEICGEWTSGKGLWYRALRDTTDNWYGWTRVYTEAYKPTPAAIGAAAASHSHSYLPLSGGTVTGDTTFNKYLALNAWPGYGSGYGKMWYDGNMSSICLENSMIVKGNIRLQNGQNLGPSLYTDSARGLNIMTSEGYEVILDNRGNLDVGALKCDGINSKAYATIRNVNATAADSSYLVFNRNNEVKAATFTSSDSGLGLRLHLYNNAGTWATHFVFRENGWFSTPYLEVRGHKIDLGKEGDNSAWIAFYDTTKKRIGYIGKGSSSTNTITLYAEAGDYLLGASNNYGYSRAHFMPDADNTFYLGLTSPIARRWKQLIACTTSISTSDIKNKENIIPIGETRDIPNVLKSRQLEGLNIPTEQASKRDYYEFIRDRFMPYSYNYKVDETDESVPLTEQYKLSKSIGFIANEYDLENDLVAKEFIFKTEDGLLNYNTGNYATMIAIALQEAIKEIETLKEENQMLLNRLAIIEQKLGL